MRERGHRLGQSLCHLLTLHRSVAVNSKLGASGWNLHPDTSSALPPEGLWISAAVNMEWVEPQHPSCEHEAIGYSNHRAWGGQEGQ